MGKKLWFKSYDNGTYNDKTALDNLLETFEKMTDCDLVYKDREPQRIAKAIEDFKKKCSDGKKNATIEDVWPEIRKEDYTELKKHADTVKLGRNAKSNGWYDEGKETKGVGYILDLIYLAPAELMNDFDAWSLASECAAQAVGTTSRLRKHPFVTSRKAEAKKAKSKYSGIVNRLKAFFTFKKMPKPDDRDTVAKTCAGETAKKTWEAIKKYLDEEKKKFELENLFPENEKK